MQKTARDHYRFRAGQWLGQARTGHGTDGVFRSVQAGCIVARCRARTVSLIESVCINAHRSAPKLLVALPCAVLAFFAIVGAPDWSQPDASFEPLHEVIDGSVAYRLYRSNCGATCSYALVLRKEIDVFAGVKLVSAIWFESRREEGHLELSPTSVDVVDGTLLVAKIAR